MIESRTRMRITRAILPLLVVGVLSGVAYTRMNHSAESAKPESAADRDPSFNLTDWNRDGLPDVLNLDGTDAAAFRAWFTFLAETTYYQRPEQRPAEVADCAALLRFAFREALKQHDGTWASALKLPLPPALSPISKYHYPVTPIAPNLFRIREGLFVPNDIADGAFAQFADAETLRRYNTHFISRDVRAARPGDLFFFRQKDQSMPDHAMIFLGPSHFENDSGPWVIYHTGPDGSDPGEIRRPSLEALLKHREPRWHPVPSNASFLGVYRWNILP